MAPDRSQRRIPQKPPGEKSPPNFRNEHLPFALHSATAGGNVTVVATRTGVAAVAGAVPCRGPCPDVPLISRVKVQARAEARRADLGVPSLNNGQQFSLRLVPVSGMERYW